MFKTTPMEHQLRAFERSAGHREFAYLMEQGTGKSKITCDDGARAFHVGDIDLLLIIAPNGVHRNWIINEVPKHLPVADSQYRAAYWQTALKKDERERLDWVLSPGPHLRVMAMNIEALSLKQGYAYAQKLVRLFRAFLAVDESSKIKTPGAKRTRNIIELGKLAEYRRILTGTPITKSPLDYYAQFKFLDWHITGHSRFTAFRSEYAVVERKLNRTQGREYDEIVGYKNIDRLRHLIAPYAFEVKKADCLDLPEKVYVSRPVELNSEQRRAYSELRDRLRTELSGERIVTPNVLTKLMRLQQIVGGFLVVDDRAVEVPGANNRIAALLDIVDEAPSKVIVWARFRAEIAAIKRALQKEYGERAVVTYYGGTPRDERDEAVRRFQDDPTCTVFIGQQHSAGYGLTLTAAQDVVYYSNDFSLEARLQSEDRAHRIGQRNNVTYHDLIAPGTVDEHIIRALRAKKELADMCSVRELMQ